MFFSLAKPSLNSPFIVYRTDIQLENFEKVSKLRETLVHSLQDCVTAMRHQNGVHQLSQLFLCLPLIRQLDIFTRRYWLNVLQEGSVPMNKLFVEMLESSLAL